jgi:hypothetical protein
MTDPDLPALLRAATADCPAGGRDCPDADTLAALAAGTLDPARRDAVLDRVAGCTTCADALRAALDARAFADDLARDALAAASAPRARARRAPAAFALAASLMVAVGAGVLLRAPTPDARRGATVAAIEPADDARLDAAPRRLAWDCAAPAAATLEILDATGAVAWRGPTQDCALVLPAEALARLDSGDWMWLVRAPNGTLLAGPWRFRIR